MDISQLRQEFQQEQIKLNNLCVKWQTILDDGTKKIYNEDIKGTILSVLGQCTCVSHIGLPVKYNTAIHQGNNQVS